MLLPLRQTAEPAMRRRPAVRLTVHLADGTDVDFWPDGQCKVDLSALTVARHELTGEVWFDGDGTVSGVHIEDAYVYTPLTGRVKTAAARAAWRKARFARRVARQIARTTAPVRRYEPGTLEHLAMLADGKIREDGWPKGHIPL